MKKLFISLFLLVAAKTFAQDYKAIEKMLSKNELDKAQVAIDALVEKDAAKAENHYLKYKVYKAINESEQYKKLVPNALESSWVGLKKFAGLDKNFTAMIKDNILNIAEPYDNIRKLFINSGSANLDAKNYDAAFMDFKNSLDVYKVFLDQKWTTAPLDTLITFYTGYAAMNAKKMDETEMYYKKLTDANANGTDIQIAYGWLANYYIETKKESAKGKEIAEKGLKFYPADEYLNDMVAKAIANSGDIKAIFANHEININKPNAPYAEYLKYAADLFDYLYNDSTVKSDFTEKQKKFEDVMGKGLTMKPASAEGNYLMGFHLANNAVDLDKKIKTYKNKKTPAEVEERKKLETERDNLMTSSLKYHDMAASVYRSKGANIKPNEKENYKATLRNLISFYKFKNNTERAKSYEEDLKELQ